jgi:K+-sensing histidine kinase KdpD
LFDVTGHRLAEDALRTALGREREAAARLRALDEMKTTFLHAVSHELRTPLAAILGSALTLDRDDIQLSEEDARDLVRRLASNARRLDRLLGDLLDLDRLDRGILEPKRRVVDVGDVLRSAANSPALADHPVDVIAPRLLADIDQAMLERIVENLLANAARHTPAGTRVWVRVERAPGGLTLVVEDAGPGVPEALRGGVFEPFRQGPQQAMHSPGVGIGLSLVAQFARLHHGRAWVEDRLGGGARFMVFLAADVREGSKPEIRFREKVN